MYNIPIPICFGFYKKAGFCLKPNNIILTYLTWMVIKSNDKVVTFGLINNIGLQKKN